VKIWLGGGHVLIATTAKTSMDIWLGTLTCKMTSDVTNRRGWPTSNMHPRHTSHAQIDHALTCLFACKAI
jgi:hypothetical protein